MELDKGLLLTAAAEANSDGSDDKLLELTEHKTTLINFSILL